MFGLLTRKAKGGMKVVEHKVPFIKGAVFREVHYSYHKP
jgi:hypothetical protein